jgi:peptide/nickel transport system substrate-binding protein
MLMMFSAIASVHAMPPITDKLNLKVATIEGGNPETVDPAWAYDTASGEVIFNVYDTLITFDGEHMDTYLPSLATNWTIENITGAVSPEGIPWYFRYTFQLRGYRSCTTVQAGDRDLGFALVPFAANEKHTENIAPNNVYDNGEYVYRDVDNNNVVSVNDIRLTNVRRGDGTTYRAGTTVQAGDRDLGFALVPFAANEKHTENKVANGVYDPGEFIYRDVDNNNVVSVTDHRLTFVSWIQFHNGGLFYVEDVEYSFEREMVQDRDSGPQWMLYEPLLNTWGAYGLEDYGINMSTTEGIQTAGKMIDHSVESDPLEGEVWFNLAFPGAYPPFMQILCQTWSSILSKQWINEYVIGTLGRHDWSGDWGDYTGWMDYHTPTVSPLDDPTPVMCGSGPYMLDTLSYTDKYWKVVRNTNYWRGWPADFPKLGPSQPKGYVDSLTVTWAYTWENRRDMFLAGDFDMCAVPRMNLQEMYIDYLHGKLKDGIRCIYPLPTLAVDGLFFTFNITTSSPYGKIYPWGSGFHADGIPADFFGNPDWGIHTRKAFAYAFDYNRFLQEAYLGEAWQPATAIIPGLPYYDPTVKGYTFDLAKATQEFKQVPGLWDTGFTMTILYNTGNLPRQKAAEILKANIESINSTIFHIDVSSVDWKPYLRACLYHQTPLFIIGWLADYPDAHNFAYAFYYSMGAFGAWQGYYNPTMDALVEEGIRTPDGPERAAIYHDIQVLAVADCPSVTIDQAIGRHFERSWVVDWYYNPIYPGVFAYNIWKWYYIPHALSDTTPAYPINNHLPYDTNYDGTIDGKDISICSKAFGSDPGPPVHPRWCFRADVNNDRIVDGKDLSYISKNYGKTSTIWTYP